MSDYAHVATVRCTRWCSALGQCENKWRRSRLKVLFWALTLIPMPGLAQKTNLSLADIEAAIKAGESLSAGDASGCGLGRPDGGVFDQNIPVVCSVHGIGLSMEDWGAPYVKVYTPVAWIQLQAFRAKQEFRTISTDEVDSEDVLRVYGHPVRGTFNAPSLKHVVLQSEHKKLVVQPISVKRYEIVWKGAFGAERTYYGLIALFRMEDLDRIREASEASNDGEFFITFVSETGKKRSVKVKKNRHFKHLP